MMKALKRAVYTLQTKMEKVIYVDPWKEQEGGNHYKNFRIQPAEFIHANDIPYLEGCAIKYLCRHRVKGGVEDLQKAKHYIDLLIDLEYRNQVKTEE